MNTIKNLESTEEWTIQQPEPNPYNLSKVTKITTQGDNEQRFTVEFPLIDGNVVIKEGTLWEIIQLRKELELEGKLKPLYEFDEMTQNHLIEVWDITRWNYWPRWNTQIVDEKQIRLDKELTEKKKQERIQNLLESIALWKNAVIYYTDKSKQAVIWVFLMWEEKIKKVLTKESLVKTWQMIGDIVEKWIYYTLPTIEWSLPHVKKRVLMTWKQLLDILQWKGKKSEKKNTIDQDTQ